MPLLKAKPEEKKKEFIDRCMGNPGMNKEYPNEKQRTAVCNTQWADKKDEMDICEDGDTETEDQRKAKNAVNNGVKSGKVKKPDKCDKCGIKGSLEAHHKNGYDEKNMLNITWLCKPCHKDLHVKLRKKKMGKKDGAYRIDFYPWDDLADMPDSYKFKKNFDTGFLEGKAIVTNVGVFPYVMEDGTIRKELRPPEEVFNYDSMQSLKMKPITNDHPGEMVTSENIKDLQVGSTGNDILQDQYHLAIPMVITEAGAVEDTEDGKRALSCGYKADIEDKTGVWMGMPYDAIQRNIRYNHIAIVERGRAGDDAVMKFDSLDYEGHVGVHHIDNKNFNEKGESFMPLKKFKMDGVEYEAEAPVIAAYTRLDNENKDLKTEIETLKKDSATLSGERDQAKDDAEKLKEDAEKKADVDPEVFEKAVQSRLVVLDAARRAGIEIKKDQSEMDLKKAIIVSVNPKSKDAMDKAEDGYVDARFDAVLERLDEIKEDQDSTNTSLRNDSLKNNESDKNKKEDTSESAYDRMVKADSEAYLREEVK